MTATKTDGMQDYQIANRQAKELFDSLNIQTTISQPRGILREGWACIEYDFEFKRDGKSFQTPYRLGIGHVKLIDYLDVALRAMKFSVREEQLYWAWKKNPQAQFKDKKLQAEVAGKLAKAQKVAPQPYEVLAAVCRDGMDAHGQSFEDYADCFGLDKDSRKAEATYKQCAKIYFEVEKLIGTENVEKLAELQNQF